MKIDNDENWKWWKLTMMKIDNDGNWQWKLTTMKIENDENWKKFHNWFEKRAVCWKNVIYYSTSFPIQQQKCLSCKRMAGHFDLQHSLEAQGSHVHVLPSQFWVQRYVERLPHERASSAVLSCFKSMAWKFIKSFRSNEAIPYLPDYKTPPPSFYKTIRNRSPRKMLLWKIKRPPPPRPRNIKPGAFIF